MFYLMGERSLKYRAPLLTCSLLAIFLATEKKMHSCLGQSTRHLSSTDPSDILLATAAFPFFCFSPSHSSLIITIGHFYCYVQQKKKKKIIFASSLPGRLWGTTDLSSAVWPVVYCWSDQLGTWMWANGFSRGLHSSDVGQEMDIYLHTILKR